MTQTDTASSAATAALSEHIAQSVDELAEIHLAHYRSASALQRAIDRLTALIATPAALMTLSVGVIVWILAIAAKGSRAVYHPSFGWLGLIATCSALLVAVLILVTQRREDQLADRRGQLTLELAILADKKSAKIIALLEELRRDHPQVSNRPDPVSAEMATPTDVPTVLAAIDERAGAPGAPSEDADGGEDPASAE
jgi:uncharacterized membrane protein